MKTIFKIAKTELRDLFYSPIAWFILIIFTAVFGYYSILLNYKSFDRGLVSTGYYMTPLAIPHFFMSLGIILFFIYLILDFVKMIKTKGGEK